MNTPNKLNQAPQQETEAPKKPYEKPEVIYRAPLEAVAGQCTPQPPGKALGECSTGFS